MFRILLGTWKVYTCFISVERFKKSTVKKQEQKMLQSKTIFLKLVIVLLWLLRSPHTMVMAQTENDPCFAPPSLLQGPGVDVMCWDLDSTDLSTELRKVTVSFSYFGFDSTVFFLFWFEHCVLQILEKQRCSHEVMHSISSSD